MSNALAPRIQGDDYQALCFWVQACRLFSPKTKVAKVHYEWGDLKSFDDVVVEYFSGAVDEEGNPLKADHYQVKFHTNMGGTITWQALMDPKFIEIVPSVVEIERRPVG